ncbi:MAG: excinuclease ABC subunit UvrB [Parcubacteria group bacterium]|nr:excinuclease ABC subunit UvrB [Parcubacteria group bacterium]
MAEFRMHATFKPTGDQPQAIEKLVTGLTSGYRDQTLLGVTGSGKTAVMAWVVEKVNRPTLVISHNKTLAAQLASEFRAFFPENAVHYFVSYYDYYQPEAYLPASDTYIEKDAEINEEINRLRHAATQALLSRRDVLIVASVSAIYGLGSPEDYSDLKIEVTTGSPFKREKFLRRLADIQFVRNDIERARGTYRVRGDTIELVSTSGEDVIRIELFGDEVERISITDRITGETKESPRKVTIFPAKHFVTPQEKLVRALGAIRDDLTVRIQELKAQGKLLEAQRLHERTNYDLEMLETVGYCKGIENYSRNLSSRNPGEPPATLLEYFPDDFLLFIDESHITIPQIRGMYEGDRSRKQVLVDFGFRLPSALDNRPLAFTEFEKHKDQTVYVSATPGPYEIARSRQVVEQLIRPTGLLDPMVTIEKTAGQIDHLIEEIKKRVARHERVLITTLTKRMAEDLAEYLTELGIKVHYLHSDVETLVRLDILHDLRAGVYDVLVGINLLREGLDLPEVSLVAILDADKEGYLRSETSLIQTMGRAARHVNGAVILYADRMTQSMRRAIAETERRRKVQEEYNRTHDITPRSITKELGSTIRLVKEALPGKLPASDIPKEELSRVIKDLESRMKLAAENLEFELAAALRDRIKELRMLISDSTKHRAPFSGNTRDPKRSNT